MAKANHPPAFLFYPDDFSSDGKVEAMSTEQVGAFILLLCKSWREEPPASIPDDDAVLARWARLSQDRWLICKPGVLAAFTFGTDLRWHQKRQRREYDKLMGLRKQRSKAANARWNKEIDANALHKQSIPIPSPSPSPCKPKTLEPKACELPGFALFWAIYPRRIDKKKALRAWLAVPMIEQHSTEVMAGVALWKESGAWDEERYIPHPTTFINNRRWEAMPPKVGGNGTRQSDTTGASGGSLDRFEQAARNVTGRGSQLAETLRGDAVHAGKADKEKWNWDEIILFYSSSLAKLPQAMALHRSFEWHRDHTKWLPQPCEIREQYDIEVGKMLAMESQSRERLELCGDCRGTGWKTVPRPDSPQHTWAVACDCRKKKTA